MCFFPVIIKQKMTGTEMFKMRNFGFDSRGVNILKFVMSLP